MNMIQSAKDQVLQLTVSAYEKAAAPVFYRPALP